MFRRLLFDDWVMIFPLIAFITAATIYAMFVYRALRMRSSQIDHLSSLPFHDSPEHHDE